MLSAPLTLLLVSTTSATAIFEEVSPPNLSRGWVAPRQPWTAPGPPYQDSLTAPLPADVLEERSDWETNWETPRYGTLKEDLHGNNQYIEC